VQLLQEQNREQFRVIYEVRDRMTALEQEFERLKGRSWWRVRSPESNAPPGIQ
jgi:hypothetical protein